MGYTFLFKDPNSQVGGCAAIYQDNNGSDYGVVGKRATPEQLAAATAAGAPFDSGIADDETLVIIPAALVERLRAS